jgi:hypothetical protein
MGIRSALALALATGTFLTVTPCRAQTTPTPPPDRDSTWGDVTTVTATAGLAWEAVMPRIFYSDPEATVGWKARWHVSVLAPVMTLVGITTLNELVLKDAFEEFRPGCDETNQGGPNCETFGMMSSHSIAGMGALGHGVAVFIFDTTKWSDGQFNAGSLVGHVGIPLVLGTITLVGRGAGDFENTGQILAGGATGLVSGFLMGMTYSLMQRPECGYTGALVCW